MRDPTERTLGTEAIEYIQERLSNGRSLARSLLNTLALASGSVLTCISPDVSDVDANTFLEGKVLRQPSLDERKPAKGGYMEPIPNADDWLSRRIHEFLTGGPRRVCIMENQLSGRNDPWLATARSHVLKSEDDVFHFLSSSTNSLDEISDALNECGSVFPPIIAALTTLDDSDFSPDEGAINQPQIAAFAKNASAIIVGAYDGESYLIWSKP